MSPEHARLRAAPCDNGYVVRIEGRGTMADSAVFWKFAECFLAGSGIEVVVDLEDCEHLDSTFLGCLVQFHKQLAKLPNGKLVVAAPSECRRRLLTPLQLDRYFTLSESAPPVGGDWVDLPEPHDEVRALGRHIMECHRQLAELGGPQADVFARIADQLDQEIEGD